MSRRSRPEPEVPQGLALRLPETGETLRVPARLPLLPLRDAVVFPRTTIPLFVGRPTSVAALDEAAGGAHIVVAVTQRRPETSRPGRADLYQVGTIARVLQIFRLPDQTCRILVEGLAPVQIEAIALEESFSQATVTLRSDSEGVPEAIPAGLLGQVQSSFRDYVSLERAVPREVLLALQGLTDPVAIAMRMGAHLRVRVAVKQRLLECRHSVQCLRLLSRILRCEIEGLRVRPEPVGSRRALPGAVQDGDAEAPAASAGSGDFSAEIDGLAKAIAGAHMPPPVAERARRELERLARIPYLSPEAAVVRTYLEVLTDLPWRRRTRDRTDLVHVGQVLDADHFGLEKVKQRILEQIAVIKLAGEVRGPILCFAGPPGVGKTTLGRSIARALGRRFVRMSLGGVCDEADIRGHRRTYVGSLPGRIIQAMRRAGVVNPVILLDEVDKLGRDQRGDPAAALLEVLDPEQNSAFNDHYLEIDYDLSHVLFITTANVLDTIPPALRDRMEVIRIPGYLEAEKSEIARRFLLGRQLQATGLSEGDLEVTPAALTRIIREYTREAGVRGLEREIARICRRVAKRRAGGRDPGLERIARRRRSGCALRIEPVHLGELLGVPLHTDHMSDRPSRVGVATGLAWTEYGGEVLTVEVGVLPGRGNLMLTGQLGTQLRESAQAALSYIRSRADSLGIDRGFYRRADVHIHLPEAAIPKDGPSAGAAIALALVSALSAVPTRGAVAMTGEITLRGNVLPVGGLGEKTVAARRVGIATLILPRGNQPHWMELPPELRKGIEVHFVDSMDEVLALGLATRQDATGRSRAHVLHATDQVAA